MNDQLSLHAISIALLADWWIVGKNIYSTFSVKGVTLTLIVQNGVTIQFNGRFI